MTMGPIIDLVREVRNLRAEWADLKRRLRRSMDGAGNIIPSAIGGPAGGIDHGQLVGLTGQDHPAAAITLLDVAGDFAAADVEGALAELQSDAEAHAADATDPHSAAGYVREADANWIDLTDAGATTLHSHAGSGAHDVLSASHSDVDDTDTPADGDVLTWDNGAGQWIASPPTGGGGDASTTTYTPAVATDWDGDADPGDVDNALDQLAERVDDLEAVGGVSGQSLVTFLPQHHQPPATIAAFPFLRNGQPFLWFDGATDWETMFTAIMPQKYGGGGLELVAYIAFTSATSGTANVEFSVERCNTDMDADSFAAMTDVSVTPNGTAGIETQVTVAIANDDGIVAGSRFRVKVRRDADGTNGTDDITTVMELYALEVREQ